MVVFRDDLDCYLKIRRPHDAYEEFDGLIELTHDERWTTGNRINDRHPQTALISWIFSHSSYQLRLLNMVVVVNHIRVDALLTSCRDGFNAASLHKMRFLH
ncbi:hypothetical protein HZ326_31091 [Fusarium oxysporum f. sp. albedinis]|nr:hypothetical protein HZ326_31091 [Fusarium oxysporum f. sp. albedinis]